MDLDFVLDAAGQQRLEDYFTRISYVLNNKRRMASFATYVMGILGEGERKSVEPIVARACADPDRVDPAHQRLLHFLVDSTWSDRGVRGVATEEVLRAFENRGESIDAWILDDTGFLKQGTHSVGVQRQYTGSAGKVANCQVGVSLVLATATEHVPIDFELYLPRKWSDDPERRREARIPDEVAFKTKPELALDMIDRALEDRIPRGVVLADSGYGNSSAFRSALRSRRLSYAVGIDKTTKVWDTDDEGSAIGEPISVGKLALELCYKPKIYRRVTWRSATKRKLTARFAVCHVVPYHDDGCDPKTERERLWLICEWPYDETQPSKYYLCAVPQRMSNKRLIRLIKERWRIERSYEDLKGELGLDHYEGRRFPGWHHHVSCVLACYAFVVSERVRRFPPSAVRQVVHQALRRAA